MSGYQSPSSRGEAFKHEVVSYLERDILPSPAVGLVYFHFSPASKALTDAVTSGGLSKFLNAVGQGQRMKNLIRRNFFCSSKGSWGLHSLHTESPVQAGFHPQSEIESSAQSTSYSAALTMQPDSRSSLARPVPSTVLHQPFPCTEKGSPSQHV